MRQEARLGLAWASALIRRVSYTLPIDFQQDGSAVHAGYRYNQPEISLRWRKQHGRLGVCGSVLRFRPGHLGAAREPAGANIPSEYLRSPKFFGNNNPQAVIPWRADSYLLPGKSWRSSLRRCCRKPGLAWVCGSLACCASWLWRVTKGTHLHRERNPTWLRSSENLHVHARNCISVAWASPVFPAGSTRQAINTR